LAGPLVGVGGGMLGGLAGQPGPIVFLYLLSCGVSGGRFVQYSSIYVALASVALTLAMGRAGAIGLEGAAFSAICTIPILFGMWVGQRVREVVSARLFRKLVLAWSSWAVFSMVEPACRSYSRHMLPDQPWSRNTAPPIVLPNGIKAAP